MDNNVVMNNVLNDKYVADIYRNKYNSSFLDSDGNTLAMLQL